MYENKLSGSEFGVDSELGSGGEIAAPGSEKPVLEWEIREVFVDTLGLVHIALVTQYGLTETEASELEKDLYVWFVRFCMRPGNPPPQVFRALLLVASCRMAREFRRYVGIATKGRKPPKRETPVGGRAIRSTTGARRGMDSSEKAGRRVTLAVATQPALFRELLILFLNSAPGVEIVGQGSDEDEIARVLTEKGPAVLVFDYEALGPNGEVAIARLRRTAPGTRILVLTTRSSEETVERVLRAGGSGVVGKQLGSAMLLRAIHAVAGGEVWANRLTVAQTLEHLADPNRIHLDGRLTRREWEIVDGISRGFRNREIARRLKISEKTVKSHVNNIFRKLQVDNRFAVGLYAWDQVRPDA
jgi:DNA-binding NarL/FixJ family response regulator